MSLSWTEPGLAQARASGLRMVTTLDLPEGRYQLRVAAGSGPANGSVLYDLDVPDFTDDPLVLSGVTLTTASAEQGLTLRPAPALTIGGKPVQCGRTTCEAPLSSRAPSAETPLRALSTPAAARRTFNSDEEVMVYVEVTRNGKGASSPITLALMLDREDGSTLPLTTETRSHKARQDPITLRVPLSDVPAGRYLLRVQATSEARGVEPVERRIPIEVRSP